MWGKSSGRRTLEAPEDGRTGSIQDRGATPRSPKEPAAGPKRQDYFNPNLQAELSN